MSCQLARPIPLRSTPGAWEEGARFAQATRVHPTGEGTPETTAFPLAYDTRWPRMVHQADEDPCEDQGGRQLQRVHLRLRGSVRDLGSVGTRCHEPAADDFHGGTHGEARQERRRGRPCRPSGRPFVPLAPRLRCMHADELLVRAPRGREELPILRIAGLTTFAAAPLSLPAHEPARHCPAVVPRASRQRLPYHDALFATHSSSRQSALAPMRSK